jgi:hypothetical protein
MERFRQRRNHKETLHLLLNRTLREDKNLFSERLGKSYVP